MQKKMTVKNIVLADNRGTVVLQETDKDKKVISSVAIQLSTPKEALEFEHGATYDVSFSKSDG